MTLYTIQRYESTGVWTRVWSAECRRAEAKKRYKPIKASAIFYPIVLVSADCDTGEREEREDGSIIPHRHESRKSPSSETHTENRSHPPVPPVADPDDGPFTFENSDAGGVAL